MIGKHIIKKDLLILTRDRRALAILVVMPLVFIAILGFSTGQLFKSQNDRAMMQLVVVDQSDSELAKTIISSLQSQESIHLESVDQNETAYAQVDDGDRVAAIIIGADFNNRIDHVGIRDLWKADKIGCLGGLDISIYYRPGNAVVGTITEQLVKLTVLQTLVPHVVSRNPLAKTLLPENYETNPFSRKNEVTTSPEGSYDSKNLTNAAYQIIVPSYAVMFAFFLINIMGRSFIAERNEGTLMRLRASPISSGELLFGKTVPFFIVSVVQGVLLFVFGKLLFGMSWGLLPWLLVPVIICTSLAATSLGLVTAVLVRTDAQVSAYANLLVITLAGVSGCFMPRFMLPEAMRDFSLVTPHAWALIAYDQLLGSGHPNVIRVVLCCVVLIVMSGLLFLVGWIRFKKQASA